MNILHISDLHINSDFLIGRENEIEQISLGLVNYNSVTIVGMGGTGKTTLVRNYARLNPLNFKNINFFQAIRFGFEKSLLTLLEMPPKNDETSLAIIDGIDELSDTEQNKILQTVKKSIVLGHKIILTSRLTTFANIHNNHDYYQIVLGSLTQSEAIELMKQRIDNETYTKSPNKQIIQLLDKLAYNPLLITSTIKLINSGRYTFRDILELIKPKLIYQNQLLIDEANPKIILPETPKIITDVKVIGSSLIEKVSRNPELMRSITPREFEEFVADLFCKKGYNVTLTPQTRDGGKDFYIVEDKGFGKFLYYIECKRYSANRPVGINLVREFYGTVNIDRATAGILVTCSYFSDEAKSFTEQIKHQMSLLEYADLNKMLNEVINCR